MQEARVTGAPLQELTRILDDLNLKMRQGETRAESVGAAISQGLGSLSRAPAPSLGPREADLSTPAALSDRLREARDLAIQLSRTEITPVVRIAPVNRLREAFAAIENRTVELRVDVLGTDDLARAVDLMNSDIGLANRLAEANDQLSSLREQVKEVVEILASARIGVGGRIEVGATAAPDSITVDLGDTTFTIHAAGGVTEGQRDEILRRVAESLDDRLETIRQRLDALVASQF